MTGSQKALKHYDLAVATEEDQIKPNKERGVICQKNTLYQHSKDIILFTVAMAGVIPIPKYNYANVEELSSDSLESFKRLEFKYMF